MCWALKRLSPCVHNAYSIKKGELYRLKMGEGGRSWKKIGVSTRAKWCSLKIHRFIFVVVGGGYEKPKKKPQNLNKTSPSGNSVSKKAFIAKQTKFTEAWENGLMEGRFLSAQQGVLDIFVAHIL